jgi:hypothetical protein
MFGGDPYFNIRQRVTAPVQTMRTFQLDQPLHTHFRRATCQEVECQAYAYGWKMGFDLSDPDKRSAARRIRDHSGRTYTHVIVGNTITFTFAAGQQCFAKHRVPLEREPLMIVRRGDWRGNPTGERMQHKSPDSFLDHWESDLDQLKTIRERG